MCRQAEPNIYLNEESAVGLSAVGLSSFGSFAKRLVHRAAQVSVCVHDDAAVIWAGEETPCALGTVCSLGSINQENNAALTAAISELIEPFGVSSDRMYLNVHSLHIALALLKPPRACRTPAAHPPRTAKPMS